MIFVREAVPRITSLQCEVLVLWFFCSIEEFILLNQKPGFDLSGFHFLTCEMVPESGTHYFFILSKVTPAAVPFLTISFDPVHSRSHLGFCLP